MNNERDRSEVTSSRSGPSPALIAAVVVAVLAVVFVLQNRRRAKIEFLFIDFNSRVWVAIVIAILIGAALDRLVQMWWRRRRSD